MRRGSKGVFSRLQSMLGELFGLSRPVSFGAALLFTLIALFVVFWFFYSAPPSTITITTGPEGSISRMNAEKYAKILARNGVKLKILPSEGSLDNLKRLIDPKSHVDVGFVQSGVPDGVNTKGLASLGSVSYQPLLIFYRSAAKLELLSQLKGKRLAIGPEGSGTRSLALVLLADNGIEPGGPTKLLDLDADDASKALIDGAVDAVFLMGDAASPQVMRTLLRTQGIRLFDFIQADAYTRRITYLNKLDLPRGSIDFGKDIPSHDIHLIGPTVELVARADLHPALPDLLIEAAQEVHGKAGLLKRRGEFPAPIEHEIRISADALRYYKSGKSFIYRYLPFRMASLVNRVLVVFVPAVIVLLPGLRLIPWLYRWRIRLRLYRWYRELLALERDVMARRTAGEREALLERIDHIEAEVNKMKVPASFADQFYVLRGHILFVHERLKGGAHAHQA
ncbi:MAG TPA: TAXI family TRAP transporter solute-binding subunit [Nitrospirota bacterium]